MDTTTVIIIVILLIALGIFIGTQIGGGSGTGNVIRSNSYPSQYGGGGCGR